MHLGRFHAVINDLARHFRDADLQTKLELAAAALDNYASSRDQAKLDEFRHHLNLFNLAAEIKNENLLQPYAAQVIESMTISNVLPPMLTHKVKDLISKNSFDHVNLGAELRTVAKDIKNIFSSIAAIEQSFAELNVEYERVSPKLKIPEAEIGVLIPRESTGETLRDLTAEFGKLSKLFRAINELSGASEYDPKVRTISSSAWQIFVDLSPEQIIVWVVAIERIIALFKSNLEIRKLQSDLSKAEVSKEITELLEKEVDKKISESIDRLAKDVRAEHSKISDENRLNELENQLRIGFRYLAKRINQGAQVEINVAVPEMPKDPEPLSEGLQHDQSLLNEISAKRARIEQLRALRQKARSVSAQTIEIDLDGQLLLPIEDDHKSDEAPL